MQTGTRDRSFVVAAVALVVVVIAIYAPVRSAGFFYLDDDYYVTANPFVRDGLTLPGLWHAFFGSHGALWMPLAFTSHMLDVSLFGLEPAGPHLVNVVLHVLNSLLLLGLLVRTTGALAPSLAAATLFAVHPLRVESVAWVAERKDVLSACFGLLAMHAWVGQTQSPSARRSRAVIVFTVLALLAKPMLVTLPLLLVCLDWWPLRRAGTPDATGRPLGVRELVLEKAPLLGLAAAAAAITLVAAQEQGALVALDGRSLTTRIGHALVAIVWYVWKTVWPTDLAVFYPLPTWATWQIAAAALGLAGAAAVAFRMRHRAPWIAAGLAWFAIGLAPVAGFFQAGGQGMADRFTYMPAIGLIVALVWTAHVFVTTQPIRAALAGAVVVVVAVFAVSAHRQVGYWSTSEALLTRTIAVTHANWRMETALGSVLANQGRHGEARPHFTTALGIEPDDPVAHYGLGLTLDGLGDPDAAVAQYRESIRLDPGFWRAHNNLGVFLLRHGEVPEALHHFSEAVRLNPGARDATDNLRSTLELAGFPKESTDGYVQGLLAWSAAIASDRDGPGGASYGTELASALLGARESRVRGCIEKEGGAHAPFSLYVQVDATGALTAVTAMPPTPVARCVREELKTAHAPHPPFAPFHATVAVDG